MMASEETKANPLSSGVMVSELKQNIIKKTPQPYEGFTPNEAEGIIEIWNEYSNRMHELINRAIQDAKNNPSKQFAECGRSIFEAAISLYDAAIEKHYSRIGRPNPNKIVLPASHRLSFAELIVTHMRLRSVIDFLFKSLLAETNYKETGIISWNMMYLVLDVTFGRRGIVEQPYY
jgi:hypothetical protein